MMWDSSSGNHQIKPGETLSMETLNMMTLQLKFHFPLEHMAVKAQISAKAQMDILGYVYIAQGTPSWLWK